MVAANLGAASLPVIVVNPAEVRAFAHVLGKRAKADPINAAVIGHFVAATDPLIRPLTDAETQLLTDLVAKRQQILATVVAASRVSPVFADNLSSASRFRVRPATEPLSSGFSASSWCSRQESDTCIPQYLATSCAASAR